MMRMKISWSRSGQRKEKLCGESLTQIKKARYKNVYINVSVAA
jgi:hypothetical protein